MFTLKCLPSSPMTQEEMEEQCRIISKAAKDLEFMTEEEIRSYMVSITKKGTKYVLVPKGGIQE